MHAIAVVQGSWWCPMCGPMFSWGSSMMMLFWLVPLVVVVAAASMYPALLERAPASVSISL